MMLISLFVLTFIASADPPAFVAETVRDDRLPCGVIRLRADGSAQIDANEVPAGQFVALRRPGPPPLRPHDRPHLLLGNGDRLLGRLLAIENERAIFAADFGQPVTMTIPLTAISAIWLTARAAAQAADPKQFDPEATRKQDVVRLSNGDAMTGSVLAAMRDGPIRIEIGKDASEIARDRIDALIFSTELARLPRPKNPVSRLVARNGARVSLVNVTVDTENVTGVTAFGEAVRMPLDELASLTVMSGPVRYLSDSKPANYESASFFGLSWPLVADHSVVRGDLRLGGGTFDKGLGLHSACRVTYPIPPGAVRFAACVGLDDVTGRRGAAIVQFLVDGQAIPHGRFDLPGGRAPVEIALPMPGDARELSIVVEFGRGGDVQDHVNLADARFVVAAKP